MLFAVSTTPSSVAQQNFTESYEGLRAQLQALLDGTSDKFINGVCSSYLASAEDGHRDLAIIERPILALAALTSDAHKLQDQVLQSRGVGRDWEKHERFWMCLLELNAGLEEMLCMAMVDADDLRDTAARQKLRGQTAGDLVAQL